MLQEPDQSQKLRLIKLQRGVDRILSMCYTVYERRAGSESTPEVLGVWQGKSQALLHARGPARSSVFLKRRWTNLCTHCTYKNCSRYHLAPDALLLLRAPRLPHVNSQGSTRPQEHFTCGHGIGETKGAPQHRHRLFWISCCQCQRVASGATF